MPAVVGTPVLSPADQKQVTDIALANAIVAALLAGHQHEVVAVTAWQNGVAHALVGADVMFALSPPTILDATVPAALRRASSPWPPITVEQRHVRADDVTRLSVQVDLKTGTVVEIWPAQATIRENTGPPFAWAPWFTHYPWLALPLAALAALIVARRARRKPKRGWGSAGAVPRGPFERFFLTLLLLVILAGYAYTIWIQVLHPSRGAAVPPLRSWVWPALVPLALVLLRALRLEYARGTRRRSWSILLVVSLATAVGALLLVHTVTNLSLGTYLAALVVALVAVRHLATPRALGQRFVTDVRFLSR
ncbi:MAG: hypothetical protein ACLQUT_13400 [Thermoleophilia bacterium]